MEQELDLLQRSINEIKQLRYQNNIMNARLQMFDSMMLLFNSRPNYDSQGMSPDLVREIEMFIDSTNIQVKTPPSQ